MQAISDNLIHFLGKQHKKSPSKQLEIFKSIIHSGLRLRKTQIKFGQGGFVDNHIVCFTDIPLSLSQDHAANYGKFGVGFKKSSIKKCGGHPVRYFIDYLPVEVADKTKYDNRGAMNDNLIFHFNFVQKLADVMNNSATISLQDQQGKELFDNETLKEWVARQITMFSFEKEMGELGPVQDDAKVNDIFYKEREWRLVPLKGNLASHSVTHDEINDLYYYKFIREDINLIVAPNDDLRIEVMGFLLGLEKESDNRLKGFAQNLPPVITYDDLENW